MADESWEALVKAAEENGQPASPEEVKPLSFRIAELLKARRRPILTLRERWIDIVHDDEAAGSIEGQGAPARQPV